MPSIIQVGGAALDGHLLVYIASLIIGYYMINLRLRYDGIETRSVMDIMMVGMISAVLIWKFGPLLFNLSLIWNNPLQILLMRGSWEHTLVGIIVAAIYVAYKLRQIRFSLTLFADMLPFGFAAAMICINMLIWKYGAPTSLPWGISLTDPDLHYHPLHIYRLLLSVVLLAWFWFKRQRERGSILQDALIYYGLGFWFISYFSYVGPDRVLFSSAHLGYLSMIVCGLIIPYIIRKIEYK